MWSGKLGDWLKNSIPGIILLGALGSILALVLLGLAKRLLIQGFTLLEKFILLNYRPYVVSRLLTRRFLNRGETAKLVVYAALSFGGWAWDSLLLLMLASLAVIRFSTSALQGWGIGYCLVVGAFVVLMLWLRDAVGAAGVFSVLFSDDSKEMKRLRRDMAFLNLMNQAMDGSIRVSNHRLAFRMANVIAMIGDEAMRAWAEHVVKESPEPERVKAVAGAHAKYQSAFSAAIEAGKAASVARGPGKHDIDLTLVAKSLGHLLVKIQEAGVKLDPSAASLAPLLLEIRSSSQPPLSPDVTRDEPQGKRES